MESANSQRRDILFLKRGEVPYDRFFTADGQPKALAVHTRSMPPGNRYNLFSELLGPYGNEETSPHEDDYYTNKFRRRTYRKRRKSFTIYLFVRPDGSLRTVSEIKSFSFLNHNIITMITERYKSQGRNLQRIEEKLVQYAMKSTPIYTDLNNRLPGVGAMVTKLCKNTNANINDMRKLFFLLKGGNVKFRHFFEEDGTPVGKKKLCRLFRRESRVNGFIRIPAWWEVMMMVFSLFIIFSGLVQETDASTRMFKRLQLFLGTALGISTGYFSLLKSTILKMSDKGTVSKENAVNSMFLLEPLKNDPPDMSEDDFYLVKKTRVAASRDPNFNIMMLMKPDGSMRNMEEINYASKYVTDSLVRAVALTYVYSVLRRISV
jgi:hypothetical protein